MTHETNDGVPPVVAAAAQIDPDLPGAWLRVAAYLDAYGDGEGILGRRRGPEETIVALTASDLRTILDGLEAAMAEAAEDVAGFLKLRADFGRRVPAPADVRAQAAAAAKVALSAGLADSANADLDELSAAAITAAAPTLEEATLRYVHAAAVGVSLDHDTGCHGYQAAARLAYMIDHGCEPEEADQTACGVTVDVAGDVFADIREKLDVLLAYARGEEPTR